MKSVVSVSVQPKQVAINIIFAALVTGLLLFCTDLFAAGQGLVSLQTYKTAFVDNEKILLGDIARIDGLDPMALKMAKKIVVGKSPLPGGERMIRLDYLKIRLKQNRLKPERINMGSSGDVLVKRRFVEISSKKINRLVSDYIKQNMPWDETVSKIKNIRVDSSVKLPKGHIVHKIYPSKNNDFLGFTNICVAFYVDGKIYRKIWVSAYIQVFERVLVASRPLGKYQPISKNDVQFKKMDLSSVPSTAIRNLDDILGKRTRTVIYPQTVIRKDQVEQPPLIKRGDLVTITAESAGIKITATGVARQLGRKGERVKVMNIDSNKTIYAYVTGSGAVSVKF